MAGAVQIGPNFYKVSARNGSTFPATITIEAIEHRVPWLWILLGVLLVLFLLWLIWYFFIRKKP